MSGTIIITGASQGIGVATADAFLDAGWTVGCMARSADKLAAFCDGKERAFALPADVTDAAAVNAAFDDFARKAGRIDALFNNAGRGSAAVPIDEIDDASRIPASQQRKQPSLYGLSYEVAGGCSAAPRSSQA